MKLSHEMMAILEPLFKVLPISQSFALPLAVGRVTKEPEGDRLGAGQAGQQGQQAEE